MPRVSMLFPNGLRPMKMNLNRIAAGAALYAAILAVPASAGVIYDSIPGPVPPNVPSLGYQATQTSEFGNLIAFDGTGRDLDHVTVLMSDWALASTYGSLSPTWDYPLTLNLYNVDNSGANPEPGSLIASVTQTFAMPWRPEADPTCPGGTAYRAGDGNCYNGYAFTVSFDFAGPARLLRLELIRSPVPRIGTPQPGRAIPMAAPAAPGPSAGTPAGRPIAAPWHSMSCRNPAPTCC